MESEDLAAELRGYCGAAPRTRRAAGLGAELDARERRRAAVGARAAGSQARRQLAAVIEYAEQARARRDELDGAEVALGRRRGRARAGSRALRGPPSCASAASPPPVNLGGRCASSSPRWRWPTPASRSRSASVSPARRAADAVEFLIAPNPGVPAGPLREIASGGELSRVMLAMMSVASALGARGDARLRRGRRRHRRPDRTRVGARLRELGERRPGALHHAPAADRLARRRHFSIVKDTTPSPRSRACRAGRAEVGASSCGCSAPTARTAARAGTRASCAAPPESAQTSR